MCLPECNALGCIFYLFLFIMKRLSFLLCKVVFLKLESNFSQSLTLGNQMLPITRLVMKPHELTALGSIYSGRAQQFPIQTPAPAWLCQLPSEHTYKPGRLSCLVRCQTPGTGMLLLYVNPNSSPGLLF